MPTGLKHYQQARQLHYITFNCCRHAPSLGSPAARDLLEETLQRVRRWYGFYLNVYVVMPEHVHLLLSEPERRVPHPLRRVRARSHIPSARKEWVPESLTAGTPVHPGDSIPASHSPSQLAGSILPIPAAAYTSRRAEIRGDR